jgi:hypothetical protein
MRRICRGAAKNKDLDALPRKKLMSEVQTQEKKATEYTAITMSDGRVVQFAGKRQMQKEVVISGSDVTVRFDYRNGETNSISSSQLSEATLLRLIGHGLAQKCGDEAAGEKDLDAIVPAVEDMMKRLVAGEWTVARSSGDSFAGTNTVIRAVAEATSKSVEWVKDFLQKKLDTAKAAVAAGNPAAALSRQELYASFKKPGTKTAAIIERLDAEKTQKASKVSAEDLLAEIEG